MKQKKMPTQLMSDGIKVCADNMDNEIGLIVLGFKDGAQLTFQGEEANRMMLHYLNGMMLSEQTKIPVPVPVEWEEIKRIQ